VAAKAGDPYAGAAAGTWWIRALLFGVCGFTLYRSGRMAMADAAAATCIPCAIRIEPSNASYIARDAIEWDERGDVSDAVDAELRRASTMNPQDSAVLRSLGIRAELRGDSRRAEQYLLKAVAVDRSFLPRWALANFYLRAGRARDFWAALRECLAIIEPRTSGAPGVNPEPVFELCWSVQPESKKILALLPPGRGLLIPYLRYLIRTGRVDAAMEAVPMLLAMPPSENDLPVRVDLCEFLMLKNRTAPAVLVWNDLVDHGLIRATRLDPNTARSIENPDFALPPFDRAFGWRVLRDEQVFVFAGDRFLAFEMARTENEHFELLSKVMPVVPGRKYLLTWQVDASRINLKGREYTGLAVRLFGPAGELSPACPPLLSSPVRPCLFTPPPGTTQIRMVLRYDRPLGQLRLEGALRLLDFALRFQS